MFEPLNLSKGENLFIWRRRQGINQIEAAAQFNVHADMYRDWESDKRTHDQPWRRAGALRPNEECVIRRRRAGLKQRELAARIGISRLWVINMEVGAVPADRLMDYWSR